MLMARMVSEGVRLPDDLDPYPDQDFPGNLLVPFMGKWQVHHKAFDNFTAFVDAAKKAGVGVVPIPGAASAYRPLRDQVNLFLSRYTTTPTGNGKPKVYKGKTYWLKPGMAMAAVPGGSMHGWGLAIDFMRDNGRAINAAERKQLRAIGAPFAVADTVSSENWHFACQNADMVAGHPVTPAPLPADSPKNDDAKLLQEAAQMPKVGLGSQSMHVALVQNILREKIHQREVQSTGNFDAVTEQAVKNFQAWYKLTVTGVVDAGDWYYLMKIDKGLL